MRTVGCTQECEREAEREGILYNFTGVQASGVIIVYCDSAVSYGSKFIGPHSSGIFND